MTLQTLVGETHINKYWGTNMNSNNMTFEERVTQELQTSLLKSIRDNDLVAPSYNQRLKIPQEVVEDCWNMVDIGKVKEQIAELIESQLAERIVNSIAAELATDIKQILSVKERREAIRSLARNNMDAILGVER